MDAKFVPELQETNLFCRKKFVVGGIVEKIPFEFP
jgi:hypothetical protein